MKIQNHFPWERLILCLIGLGFLYASARVQRDWLSYYVLLDPTKTASREGITALVEMGGVLLVCVASVVIFFITGSTKSLSDMFKFSSSVSDLAQSTSQDISETIDDESPPKPKYFDDLDEIP